MQLDDGVRPTVVGSGLIALDLIITSSGSATHTVGGTCANVLALLATHMVNVRPAVKIGDDVPGVLIQAQMASFGSDLSLVLKTSGMPTARIVEFPPPNGSMRHRFAFTCPRCARRLPRNSALREEEARNMAIDWSSVDLFFFDRATPAAVYLARLAKEAGVTVMFEPPRAHSETRLYQGASLADIIKYSSQDYRGGLPLEVTRQLRVLIETQGKKGLRYRYRQDTVLNEWRSLPVFDSVRPRDAAGAGDWCTAGFIWEMVKQRGSWNWNRAELEAAMTYGQALAAISTCFIGPLGALFALSKEELTSAVHEVLKKGSVPPWARLRGEDEDALGPEWPPNIRPPHGVCEVCLMEPTVGR